MKKTLMFLLVKKFVNLVSDFVSVLFDGFVGGFHLVSGGVGDGGGGGVTVSVGQRSSGVLERSSFVFQRSSVGKRSGGGVGKRSGGGVGQRSSGVFQRSSVGKRSSGRVGQRSVVAITVGQWVLTSGSDGNQSKQNDLHIRFLISFGFR